MTMMHPDTMTAPQVVAYLEPMRTPLPSMLFSLKTARRLITESGGRLTWWDAGETWASITLAHPDTTYPPL
jgi:hypothetical protein